MRSNVTRTRASWALCLVTLTALGTVAASPQSTVPALALPKHVVRKSAGIDVAEAIIEEPSVGLNKATKTKVAIYVQPADSGAVATRIANTLAHRLSAAGFKLVPSADHAALVVKAAVLSGSDPAPDLTTGQLEYYTTVDLSLSATWATDGSSLLSTTVTASAEAPNQNSTADAALSNPVDAIVKIFTNMVKK